MLFGRVPPLAAGNFLLLETPVGKLDLVREENTASHDMHKLEFGLNSTQALLGFLAIGERLYDFDTEQVVCVALKAGVTVRGDLILPVGLGDRSANIVRVHAAISGDVVKTDQTAILDERCLLVIPSQRTGEGGVSGRVDGPVDWLGGILHEKHVVLILVGVKSDLLLVAAGGVHVRVRMEIATLGVVVANADARSKGNVGWDISHTLGVKGGLKLAAHEAVAITRIDEAEEVDSKHAHVEADGDNDQAEDASKKMLKPHACADVPGISKENPELESGERSDPSNSEKANPLDTDGSTQAETRGSQPEPPTGLECVSRTQLVLVGEASPRQGSQGREDDQGRVEQDETRVGDQGVLEDDETGTQDSGGSAAASSLDGQEDSRDGEDTTDGRQQSHGDVGHVGLEVILANIFEVEVAIKSSDPAGQSDQQLGERRVYVHEEFPLDVFAGEATEMDLIEDNR